MRWLATGTCRGGGGEGGRDRQTRGERRGEGEMDGWTDEIEVKGGRGRNNRWTTREKFVCRGREEKYVKIKLKLK